MNRCTASWIYICVFMHSALVHVGSYALIHMKACAGWRWSNMAMCSSMLLVSTNADCFDTSCHPSVAIEQIGCAHAKLKADIQLLFLGEVSMAESMRIRCRLVISGAKEDN